MGKHTRKKHRRFSSAQKVVMVLLFVSAALLVATVSLLFENASLRKELSGLSAAVSSSNTVSAQQPDDAVTSQPDNVLASQPAVSSVPSSAAQNATAEDNKWKLRLANGDNVLPADFTVETGLITPAYARDSGMSFDKRAVGELNEMLAAANSDGVNLLVISCFRTLKKQTNLYNAEVQKWLNQGYSDADARVKAGTIVAVPGTSDHNLGLAVDLNSVEQSFEDTKQFTWLSEHAAEYGFVMRYPKDKEAVTKIIYEPWHYRYVGKEHAKKMNELNMCLEEYVAYLGISF